MRRELMCDNKWLIDFMVKLFFPDETDIINIDIRLKLIA